MVAVHAASGQPAIQAQKPNIADRGVGSVHGKRFAVVADAPASSGLAKVRLQAG